MPPQTRAQKRAAELKKSILDNLSKNEVAELVNVVKVRPAPRVRRAQTIHERANVKCKSQFSSILKCFSVFLLFRFPLAASKDLVNRRQYRKKVNDKPSTLAESVANENIPITPNVQNVCLQQQLEMVEFRFDKQKIEIAMWERNLQAQKDLNLALVKESDENKTNFNELAVYYSELESEWVKSEKRLEEEKKKTKRLPKLEQKIVFLGKENQSLKNEIATLNKELCLTKSQRDYYIRTGKENQAPDAIDEDEAKAENIFLKKVVQSYGIQVHNEHNYF